MFRAEHWTKWLALRLQLIHTPHALITPLGFKMTCLAPASNTHTHTRPPRRTTWPKWPPWRPWVRHRADGSHSCWSAFRPRQGRLRGIPWDFLGALFSMATIV